MGTVSNSLRPGREFKWEGVSDPPVERRRGQELATTVLDLYPQSQWAVTGGLYLRKTLVVVWRVDWRGRDVKPGVKGCCADGFKR